MPIKTGRGLVCEVCGHNRWRTTNTWRLAGGQIRRRRRCRACRGVIYTLEQLQLRVPQVQRRGA